MKILCVILLAIAFGVLMSLRHNTEGMLPRALIAGVAFGLLGLMMQICAQMKKQWTKDRS
jgi:hypothetical protein